MLLQMHATVIKQINFVIFLSNHSLFLQIIYY